MRFDAVIFDIDNVLIDTRASYTDCIRKTVETYLQKVLGFQPSRAPLISREDVETFKSLGGFNDDWDTCYGLLLYFLQLKTKRKTINELRKQLAGTSSEAKKGTGSEVLPVPFFKSNLSRTRTGTAKPLGVKGAEKLWGKRKEVILQKIADIFQRFYLSDFVWNEKLIISRAFLKGLKRSGIQVAIVTGRNREEADFALRRFKIDDLIDVIVTADDTPRGLKKPNPYGLLKIASKLGKDLRYLYVGDLPDDILATQQARKKMRILSCGFLTVSTRPQEMKRELKRAGTDFICEGVSKLVELLK